MIDLANQHEWPVTRRTLNQAERELLLAESGDWAFQIYTGTTVEYASRRFRSHIIRFHSLASQIESGQINKEQLADLEAKDNLFAEIDFGIYKTR